MAATIGSALGSVVLAFLLVAWACTDDTDEWIVDGSCVTRVQEVRSLWFQVDTHFWRYCQEDA